MTPSFRKTVTRFDRAKIAPWMALRNAGGGLIMSIGALNVSFSDGSDPYGIAPAAGPSRQTTSTCPSITPVSYTHLDVYKRQ